MSGGRLISRIQHRTFAGNSISNVDHVTVRHPSSNMIRDTQPAARKLTETSFNFTPLIKFNSQYLARVNTDAHIKAVVLSIDIKSARAEFNILSVIARSFACVPF